jgi:primosomal protein N' (replication factor Y)
VIAKVVPLTRTRAVRGLFDYRLGTFAGAVDRAGGVSLGALAEVPDDSGTVGIGSVVRVPFGGRPVTGVVAGLASDSEVSEDRLADIVAVLPVRLPPDLVDLALWMAGEYCSTPARALSVILPPGAARGTRRRETLLALATPAGREALIDGTRLTDGQRTALAEVVRRGESPAAPIGTAVLRRLESRGLVELRGVVAVRRASRHAVSSVQPGALGLTDEQAAALAPVVAALREGSGQRFLLHGVTGSGKTEVFLQAASAALAAGRSVIILVPEIGLTPQALARFEARFGDVVAVIHSGLGESARHDEWLRLARGEARVCVGPRSAVFAPLRDIGLIVVDEEHESSYKHEGDPRYDARLVAERRASSHGAVLVAGSATPRPESVARLRRVRLTRRVDGRPLPPVEVLDMRGLNHPLHPRTRMALADCHRAGGKAIVLLNRRGWSNFLSCASCGHVWMCPNCEVALVLHRTDRAVACHHCGWRERVPERCPSCGGVSVARHGAGTERLEHELLEAFGGGGGAADFPVLRLDADAAGFDARARTLERFHAAPAGVLVGTQMIAKGHDFSDVALGVVVDADQTLRFPDFRSEERTFSLVTQLAGRAGRGGGERRAGGLGAGEGGRVLVQTMAPEARPIVLAARHDADGFLAGELERRRILSYPPFATLIRIVCSASAQLQGSSLATAAADALRFRIDPPGATVLGPAPLFTLRGRARAQLVIKASDRAGAIAAAGGAVDAVSRDRRHRGVAFSVDVDPQ